MVAVARLLAALAIRARWTSSTPAARQRIYVANHTSHMDFLVLWSSLPTHLRHRTRPVAAADYWLANPLRRFLIEKVFHGVLIDRKAQSLVPNPIQPALDALTAGDSLIFFPEGTRGPGPGLQPLKSGIYHLAKAYANADIIPVWIHYGSRSLTFGAPVIWDWPKDPGKDAFLDTLRSALYAIQPRNSEQLP